MAKRVARKIKRAGKTAFQFSFTSTFEYIDLECKGSWRPDNLKVIWLRNHRRAQSINVEWVCTDDRGPNGASGRAVFDPPIPATLIVTLYKDNKQKKGFEEKEYKYYIENEGPTGKKILASFTCDMAEYAEVPSSRHALEMNFKPISTKVRKCHLGVTLDSRFTKEGNPNDDDMQSTFSADVGGEDNKLVFADEDEDDIDEDDLDEAATLGAKIISNMTISNMTNAEEKGNVEVSIIMLGTGQTLKRSDINTFEPPKKPPRTNSVADLLDPSLEHGDNSDTQPLNNDNNDGLNNDGLTHEQTQQDTSSVSSNEQSLTDTPNQSEHNTKTEPHTTDIQTESNTIATQSNITDIHPDSNTTITQSESNPEVTQSESNPEPNATQPEFNAAQSESNTGQSESNTTQADESNTTHPESQAESHTTHPESNTTQSKSTIAQSESNTAQSESNTAPSESNTAQPESNTTQFESSTTQSDSNTVQPEPNTLVNAHLVDQSREAELTPPTEPITDFQISAGSNADIDAKPPSTTTQEETTASSTTDTTEDQPQVVQQTQETTTTAAPPTNTTTASGETIPWLPDIELVDYMDKPIDISRITSTDVIAFYFSASWCPPCKTFLPNLKKFYNALKENNKSFEIIYVSSDYSREEMVAYMNETTMPWTAVRYGHKLADKLRQDYSIRVIPILVVVSRSGDLIDENAKKQVDKVACGTSPTAACIQLFNKWVDKMNNVDTQEDEGSTATTSTSHKSGAGAIMSSIKKALSKDEDKKSLQGSNDELREATESKTPKSKINTGGNKEELLRQLQEKENVIRQLEEVNLSLKHTNDDLNTEVRNLKARIELQNDELKSLKETDEQQKKDDEMFKEYLKLQGWLFKRGIKGPTANKWRRRYFRLDQGSKLYYYKNHTEGTPQGHVDLLKVIEVKELTSAQQDKNNASFNIVCEGRTYQLLAYDEAEMRRWITAIGKVKEFYLKQQSIDASAN